MTRRILIITATLLLGLAGSAEASSHHHKARCHTIKHHHRCTIRHHHPTQAKSEPAKIPPPVVAPPSVAPPIPGPSIDPSPKVKAPVEVEEWWTAEDGPLEVTEYEAELELE